MFLGQVSRWDTCENQIKSFSRCLISQDRSSVDDFFVKVGFDWFSRSRWPLKADNHCPCCCLLTKFSHHPRFHNSSARAWPYLYHGSLVSLVWGRICDSLSSYIGKATLERWRLMNNISSLESSFGLWRISSYESTTYITVMHAYTVWALNLKC